MPKRVGDISIRPFIHRVFRLFVLNPFNKESL